MKSLKAPIVLSCIMGRKQVLVARQQSTPYERQNSALEMEFKKFLESTSQRDVCTAVPDDVVDLLICKTALQTFLPLSVMQTHLYTQSLRWRSTLVCAVY